MNLEKKIILWMILSNGRVLKNLFANYIYPSDFTDRRNQILFSAMTKLVFTGKEIEIVSLVHELKNAGQYQEAGGKDYLLEIVGRELEEAQEENPPQKE